MNKIVPLMMLIFMIDLFLVVNGVTIGTSPVGFVYSFIQQDSIYNLQTSNTTLTGTIPELLNVTSITMNNIKIAGFTTAGIIGGAVGFAVLGKQDFFISVVMAIASLTMIIDLVAVFNIFAIFSTELAMLLVLPLVFIYIWAIYEWIRTPLA